MDVENDTLPNGGTGTDMPENDTPETLTYYDPDEDEQDTGAGEAVAETDEGTQTDEEGAAPEAETEEADAEASTAPATVSLPDGSKVSLDELTKGYLRQSDYTRKQQAMAEKSRALDADLQRIDGITNAFIDHLASMIPAEPDTALALRSPDQYVRAKAQYDAAVAQVQKLIELGSQPKQIKDALSSEAKKEKLAEENRKLAERFPHVANEEGRKKFFESVADAAQEIGYSLDDLNSVDDHRLFALGYWANEGMKAHKAREAAKAKVANAPPATPRKPGQPAQTNKNADAMRKLARSGSIRDALKIDWD